MKPVTDRDVLEFIWKAEGLKDAVCLAEWTRAEIDRVRKHLEKWDGWRENHAKTGDELAERG